MYPPENITLPASASRRGPTLGRIMPAPAADMPREKIVILKASAVSVNDQPSCLTRSV